MKKSELKAIAQKGEDSRLQFKQDIRNVDALAAWWPFPIATAVEF